MNHEELAKLIHGRESGEEITREEINIAKVNGLVVAFGYSDDCLELKGELRDEIGCDGGREFKIGRRGILQEINEFDELKLRDARKYIELERSSMNTIKAEWCPSDLDCSWRISIDCPHSTFSVMEDGELFCVGIVFAIADLKKPEEILA